MLNKIISYSLHNRLLILFAAILLFFIGSYTAMKMEVDVFPDLNAPTVVIMTEAPGMASEEVERLVTFPVETAVNGATDVRRVRSSSTTGFSVVWVEFNWGTDIYRARQITSEKLAVMSESLPANVGTPTLGPQSSILGEVMILGITSDSTGFTSFGRLGNQTATSLHRWCRPSNGYRRRNQRIPDIARPGPHEALRHRTERGHEHDPEHESKCKRWYIIRIQ